MTYDHWKTSEPDCGDEPLAPPTPEEERAEAWEYWHQRALKAEQECLRLCTILAQANNQWRHEFSVEVEAAADRLFKRLSANNTDPFGRKT